MLIVTEGKERLLYMLYKGPCSSKLSNHKIECLMSKVPAALGQ